MIRHRKTLPQKSFPQQQPLSQPVEYQYQARQADLEILYNIQADVPMGSHANILLTASWLVDRANLGRGRSGRPVGLYWGIVLIAGRLLFAAAGVSLPSSNQVCQHKHYNRLRRHAANRRSPTFFGTDFLGSAFTAACLALTFFFAATAGLD